jgi:hypothetical protein
MISGAKVAGFLGSARALECRLRRPRREPACVITEMRSTRAPNAAREARALPRLET